MNEFDSQETRSITRATLLRRGAVVVAAASVPAVVTANGGVAEAASNYAELALDDSLKKLQKKGVARLGMTPAPPYCYTTSSGKPTGYENDEAQLILRRLGIHKVAAKVVDFAALIPGLQAGRFDVCTGALYIKPERCSAVLYAQPDIADLEAFAVQKGNPLGIKSYDDVAKNHQVNLGVIAGAAEHGYAQQAGVPDSRVQEYPDFPSALAALDAGRVNAVGFDNISIGNALKKSQNARKFSMSPAFTVPAGAKPTFAAMTFNHGANSLRDAWNRELRKAQKAGELVKLAAKYGIPAKSITVCYGVTTKSLHCKG